MSYIVILMSFTAIFPSIVYDHSKERRKYCLCILWLLLIEFNSLTFVKYGKLWASSIKFMLMIWLCYLLESGNVKQCSKFTASWLYVYIIWQQWRFKMADIYEGPHGLLKSNIALHVFYRSNNLDSFSKLIPNPNPCYFLYDFKLILLPVM
jgi:hypothetical protein